MSDNKYEKGAFDYVMKGAAEGGISGGTLGLNIGWDPLSKGIGLLLGGTIGILTGSLLAKDEYDSQVRAGRDSQDNIRRKQHFDRNKLIRDAKIYIGNTRSSFDTTYGKGMYDEYDAIFKDLIGVDANTPSLTQFIEDMSFDRYAGTIATSAKGVDKRYLGGTATNEDGTVSNIDFASLSASALSQGYYEYLSNKLRTADTAFGMQMQRIKSEENNTLNIYRTNISDLTFSAANQFKQTFLQRVSENVSGEAALGQAALEQASSGLRGGNLTTAQQFQNDLAAVAYASTMDYLVGNYISQGKSLTTSTITTIEGLRSESRISVRQQLDNLILQFNKSNADLANAQGQMVEKEETIEEINKDIDERTEYLKDGDKKAGTGFYDKSKLDMGDIF